MLFPQTPENEDERILALHEFNILDTLPEKDFDDITLMASQICNTPISLITLVDVNRQWFKSHHGLAVTETPREQAFCAHAINTPGELFIVPDSSKDDRFSDNPLATGYPHVAFYAGIPLVTSGGYALGTLCVIDNSPRNLTESQVLTLRALANQIVAQMELRKKVAQLKKKQKELERSYEDLEKFAYIASHDLKAPLNNIVGLTEIMKTDLEVGGENSATFIEHLNTSARELVKLIDGILSYSKNSHVTSFQKEKVRVTDLIAEVIGLLKKPEGVTINYPHTEEVAFLATVPVKQILLNLCSNALKFSDQEHGVITIGFAEDSEYYNFSIADNGKGIPKEEQSKIFDLFHMIRQHTDDNASGSGIGLSTVKRLTEKLGGEIMLTSTINEGSTFNILIAR